MRLILILVLVALIALTAAVVALNRVAKWAFNEVIQIQQVVDQMVQAQANEPRHKADSGGVGHAFERRENRYAPTVPDNKREPVFGVDGLRQGHIYRP